MGRMSRNKGKGGELEFSKELTWQIDCTARRGRQYSGDPDAPDVKTDIDDLHFEVKRTESLSLYRAMSQAIEDCGDKIPVVAHRRNNKPWLIVLRLDDLNKFVNVLKDKV
jgi:hypothetical protein